MKAYRARILRLVASRDLPTGTITFLFSDMSGSTRLVAELGPAVFADVLERHNTLLRTAFAAHAGIERGTQGDSFLVMFREAPAAIAAAGDAQRALAAVEWPAGREIRVRMGIHTGVGILGGDDYVGLDVNRAARIASAAHGGQVLVSDSTRALTDGSLPPGLELRDLGEHRLPDLSRPERLHQLVIEGLANSFPPVRADAIAAHTVPQRVTSFIGRERELAELGELLKTSALITLTGPGGSGKTSLAMELGRSVAGRFEHGAWWIPLDSVPDADLVAATIAASLELIESPGEPVERRLASFLADRSVLLVIDNFEHLMPAAALIGQLVGAGSGLRVVITSRAPLHLGAEQEYPVPPLGIPGPVNPVDVALESPAVRLFVERARRVRPAFELSDGDAPAVAEICRRLDGLPLGIELAASRIGLLPPAAIAERLAVRLDLPGPSARDAPERQRTLGSAIAWSYDLLRPAEQRLLARLSVFAGGCRLDEAEAVGGSASELDGLEVIEVLSTLVDQSLVQPVPGADGAEIPAPRDDPDVRGRSSGRRRRSERDPGAARSRLPRACRNGGATHGDAGPARLARPSFGRTGQPPGGNSLGHGDAGFRGRAATWQRALAVLANARPSRGGQEHDRRDARAARRGGANLVADARCRSRRGAVLVGGGSAAGEPVLRRRVRTGACPGRSAGDGGRAVQPVPHPIPVGRRSSRARGVAPGGHAALSRTWRRAITRPGDVGDGLSDAREWRLCHSQGTTDGTAAAIRELDDAFYVALSSGAISGLCVALGDLPGATRWGVRSLRASAAMGDLASITLTLRGHALVLLAAGLPEAAATAFAVYERLSRQHGYKPPVRPESYFDPMWMAEEATATFGAPEYADDRRRGASMSVDEAIEFVASKADELAAGTDEPGAVAHAGGVAHQGGV